MTRDDTLRATLAPLFANHPDTVVVLTPGGRLSYANVPGDDLAGVFSSPPPAQIVAAVGRVASMRQGETLGVTRGETPLRLTLSPVVEGEDVTGVLGIATDATEARDAQDRLRNAQAAVGDARGLAQLGAWEWTPGQKQVAWSDELYVIYGLDPATFTPTTEGYLTRVHPDDRELIARQTQAALVDHQPFAHDIRIIRPDGTLRYLHSRGRVEVDADGKVTKLAGISQDITERVIAEGALAEAGKNEAIGRLAAGIAHDFNNVLAVALTNVDLLQSKLPPDHPHQQHLSEIATAAAQGARLTRQLLTVGRGSDAKAERLDLGKMIQGLQEFLQRAVGTLIEIEIVVSEPRPLVTINRSEFEQILLNLIVNAKDAMPRGGTITVAVGPMGDGYEVPRPVDPASDPVVLTVSDTGIGMEESVRARVFDPYFSTKSRGHGLGLATVFGIVRRAGGAVTVHSRVGVGTTFRVFLPRERDDLASLEMAAAKPAAGFSGTVLLVDDQDTLRRSLHRLLTTMGFEVIEARDGSEALAVLREPGRAVDVLLTDVVMPGMNGIELVRRAFAERRDVKAVVMTGSADEGLLAQRDGPVPVLTKPFSTTDLAEALRRVLKRNGH